MNNKISIVIPCLNEEKYIAMCLDSLVIFDYDKLEIEILIVDGLSSDKTREIVRTYIEKYHFIKLLDNPNKIAPIAMNIGINMSKGKYIFIISAHAQYNTNYFTALRENIDKLDADCVGGVLITKVKNKNKKSSSIKEVLMHKFGVGNASFRVGTERIKPVDTVAFGCYRRSTFDKYGMFNEKLIRNQDIELNKRIVNAGGKIYLIPNVKCTYYARENFIELIKNQYKNGFWNILTAYYTKTLSALSLRHFIPLLFILSLLIPFIVSFFFPKVVWLAIFSLVNYFSLVIIISLRLKNSSNSLIYLIGSFLTLHFSYGIGSLMGIFTIIKKRIKGNDK